MKAWGSRRRRCSPRSSTAFTRHSPEGVWFKKRAEEVGFKKAVQERDSGEPIAPGVSADFFSF